MPLLIFRASALTIAGVLLWAGLEKARNPASISSTITELGVPRRVARPAAIFLIVTEISIGVLVLFQPSSVVVQMGIVMLALLFAFAGLIVWMRGKRIQCGCFGAGARGYLGLRQTLNLVPWCIGAAILKMGPPEGQALSESAALFASVALVIAAWRGYAVLRAQHEARGDRLSAKEMYSWLRSH